MYKKVRKGNELYRCSASDCPVHTFFDEYGYGTVECPNCYGTSRPEKNENNREVENASK